MCGIIGVIGKSNVSRLLLDGLRRLEYRGYDSAGVATLVNGKIERRRAEGKISNLEKLLKHSPLNGTIGIAHTRWATHGIPNEKNAHPHANNHFAIVHNGIIENFKELKSQLMTNGYKFYTDTDSEVIVHLASKYMKDGLKPIDAVSESLEKLNGAFALGILIAGEENILLAARRGSPLAIGYGKNEMYLGSDAIGLAPLTSKIMYLEDGDLAIIKKSSVEVLNSHRKKVHRKKTHTLKSGSSIEKGGFEHFMLKEIHEQPTVLGETIKSYIDPQTRHILEPKINFDFKKLKKLSIVACGTSFYAAMVAKLWFEKYAKISTEVDIASEYRYKSHVSYPGEGIILVSQSGETADTIAAMNSAKERGLQILSIVNVLESTIARNADSNLFTLAGPEIGVASTKAFTTQLATLACLVIGASKSNKTLSQEDEDRLIDNLIEIPSLCAEVLALEKSLLKVAQEIKKSRDVLYVGRGLSYPISLEGALKLKEISYIHAEAYAAGELKHGPIALIDDGVPVVAIAPSDELFFKTASNIQEVAARGAKVILISDKKGAKELENICSHVIEVPQASSFANPILYTIPVQLLAYYTAVLKGTDVDKPRNLAKSVTVE